jgi:hypothetical protein
MRVKGVGEVIVLLATVGSFLVALWQGIYFTGPSEMERRQVWQGPQCNWEPYRQTLSRLRGIPKALRPVGVEKLGEDAYFAYSYDHETEQAVCQWLRTRPRARVEASRQREQPSVRRQVILVCVLVIAIAGIGLKLIQMLRDAQRGK